MYTLAIEATNRVLNLVHDVVVDSDAIAKMESVCVDLATENFYNPSLVSMAACGFLTEEIGISSGRPMKSAKSMYVEVPITVSNITFDGPPRASMPGSRPPTFIAICRSVANLMAK